MKKQTETKPETETLIQFVTVKYWFVQNRKKLMQNRKEPHKNRTNTVFTNQIGCSEPVIKLSQNCGL